MTASAAAAAAAAAASAPAQASTPRLKLPNANSNLAAADRRSNRPAATDPLSDRATQALIRRTLCPQQSGDKQRNAQPPIEDLLSPLTSRNDVDLQLYAFLAIVLREFVQSWYGNITTDDAFVAEILHIIAHCTRALEQRARKLDLEALVLNEIPEVLDKHIAGEIDPTTSIGPQLSPRKHIAQHLCPPRSLHSRSTHAKPTMLSGHYPSSRQCLVRRPRRR